VRIQVQEIMQQDFAPTLLFELIKEYGFNYTQAKQVLETDEESMSGSLYFSGSHRMLRDRQYLIIEENKIAEVEQFEISEGTLSINSPIQLLIEKSNKLKIIPKQNIAQLDINKLVFPLQLRHWKKGDFFYPLGMKGRKKLLSDFFIDQKLSLFEKENVWLLCSNEQIVWIVSYRLDDRFKITETTTEIYQLTYLPKPIQ
jgi:tRNA(Ile)-lysidine synthase